jgi:hypothetical protein
MLNVNDAEVLIKKKLPNGRIQKSIEYNGLYIFQVFFDDEIEGIIDPFYSINKSTGEFNGFSLFLNNNYKILELFN